MRIAFPVVVTVGPLSVSAHLIFESVAYAVGFYMYSRSRRLQGDFLPASDRYSVIAAAVIGAALGSRILFWFEDPALTLQHIFDPFYLLAGKTIVGGLLGGTLAVEWVKRRTGITRRTGDLFAIPMAVAIAIGRIGCFLEGLPDHSYGIATTLPWGVDFGDGIHRHPTQLYEVLFLAALAFWLRRQPCREGDRYRTFLVAYLTFRLAIDFLKPGVPFAGLTCLQWACVIGILAYWRDIPFLIAPAGDQRLWVSESAPISSMTPLPPSALSATAEATPRSSSKKETSTS
jgi:phosphatidylglycerol---prolipoprotein diacylglyceryl transferase